MYELHFYEIFKNFVLLICLKIFTYIQWFTTHLFLISELKCIFWGCKIFNLSLKGQFTQKLKFVVNLLNLSKMYSRGQNDWHPW